MSPGEIDVPLEAMRIFLGYAGWGPGQLDNELAVGAWFTIEPRPDDVFTTHPETLWSRVLAHQNGRLAMFAHCPTDPTTN